MKILFLLAITALPVLSNRKYDLDVEAMKLYGADLETVIKRFRQTPEYMKILEGRKEYIKKEFMNMLKLVIPRFKKDMSSEITKLYTDQKTGGSVLRYGNMRFNYWPNILRQEEEDKEKEKTTESPAAIFDTYISSFKIMSPKDMAYFSGQGYKYFGKVIHYLVKILNGGESKGPERNTVFDAVETTTQHVLEHTISLTPPDVSVSPEHGGEGGSTHAHEPPGERPDTRGGKGGKGGKHTTAALVRRGVIKGNKTKMFV